MTNSYVANYSKKFLLALFGKNDLFVPFFNESEMEALNQEYFLFKDYKNLKVHVKQKVIQQFFQIEIFCCL